jgi:hypothetical protein
MKNYIYGVISSIFSITVIAIICFWPPSLNLIFDNLFWLTLFSFVLCTFIIGHLFYTNGGSSRNVRFVFGILLIISAIVMFSGFEQITSNTSSMKQLFSSNYNNFFIYLTISLAFAKNITAFGFAALGANITANAIIESNSSKKATVTKTNRIK